jgi:hypothetical protein
LSRDLLLSGALLLGWYVMVRWVLPGLGVPT